MGGENFEGAMIGWRSSLKGIKTEKKTRNTIPNLLFNRIELGPDLYTAQKVSQFHSFYWLIGILRWGKDEYITPERDLVALDFDRSNYYYTLNPRSSTLNFTWCFTCYMDRNVFDTFYGIYNSKKYSMSNLIQSSLQGDTVFPSIYSRNIGHHLDKRVELLLECITDCIMLYGEENVLLDETPPPADLILTSYFHKKKQ